MEFKGLKNLEVKASKVADFTFYQIEGEPVLHLAPATEANKPYFNALLKVSRKNQSRIMKGNFTAGVIAENRDNDRVLYPKYIVKGWSRMEKVCGDLPCTPDNVRAFLDQLPDWLFDDVRNFATDSQNFIDLDVDVEETAGNLQEG